MHRRDSAQIASNRLEAISAKSTTTLSVIHHHYMPATRCYTPQLRREVVRWLYYRAKAEGVPMTTLANRLLESALDQQPDHPPASVIAESPPSTAASSLAA